jgi:hypothetical protein
MVIFHFIILIYKLWGICGEIHYHGSFLNELRTDTKHLNQNSQLPVDVWSWYLVNVNQTFTPNVLRNLTYSLYCRRWHLSLFGILYHVDWHMMSCRLIYTVVIGVSEEFAASIFTSVTKNQSTHPHMPEELNFLPDTTWWKKIYISDL